MVKRINGWIKGWLERIDRRVNGWIKDGQKYKWLDKRIVRNINGWIKGWLEI